MSDTGLPSGDQSAVEPPGPIPNPEVKRCSANGSGTIGPVRVGRRQVYARLQANQCLEPGSFFALFRLFKKDQRLSVSVVCGAFKVGLPWRA